MKFLRSLLLVAIVSVLVAPTAASAHGERVTTRPGDGATQKKAPDHVMVNLTEAPSDRNAVTVLDGCSRDVVDEVYTQAKTLHVLLDKGQPGDWKVEYQVISKEDGHKTADQFAFKVQGKANCSDEVQPIEEEKDASDPDDIAAPDTGPDATSQTSDESSLPIVPIAVGVVILLALAFGVRVASSRK